MFVEDARRHLDQLIRERRETYGSVSQLLGRNAAYVQQFIKRGVPRKLDELDRRKLAAHFGVDEALLGGAALGRVVGDLSAHFSGTSLPFIDGSGAGPFMFDGDWLRGLTPTASAELAILRVQGDVMHPTLADGDHVIINRADGCDCLRDGLYAIEVRGTFQVRRIAIAPQSGFLNVGCDNAAYPSWTDCRIDDLALIGRAIWVGRSLR